jgi:hypothetical protein
LERGAICPENLLNVPTRQSDSIGYLTRASNKYYEVA